MTVVLSDRVYTVEDYLQLQGDQQYELIGGKLIMVPRSRYKHQKIAGRFFMKMENFLENNPMGEAVQEVDVHLGDEVVAPDVLFISRERLDIIGELNIQGAPDLVIEILSPATAIHDKKKKSRLYLIHGVKEFWLVDPDNRLVDVYVAGEKEWRWMGTFDQEDVLTTDLLPGMEIRLVDIFKGLKN